MVLNAGEAFFPLEKILKDVKNEGRRKIKRERTDEKPFFGG